MSKVNRCYGQKLNVDKFCLAADEPEESLIIETPNWHLCILKKTHTENADLLASKGRIFLPNGDLVRNLGDFYDGLLGNGTRPSVPALWLLGYKRKDIEEGVVLKAMGGDRAANIDAIADSFQQFIEGRRYAPEGSQLDRQMTGYCEQLRIIASELRGDKRTRPDAFAIILESWLKTKKLFHDTRVYSKEEWEARNEKIGKGALVSITAEGTGSLNMLWNYRPNSKFWTDTFDEFNQMIVEHGYWVEQGFSWSWHFYPDTESQGKGLSPVERRDTGTEEEDGR